MEGDRGREGKQIRKAGWEVVSHTYICKSSGACLLAHTMVVGITKLINDLILLMLQKSLVPVAIALEREQKRFARVLVE